MRSTIFSTVALAILGLSSVASGASAQAIYVEEYPTVVAPDRGYVVRQTVVASPPSFASELLWSLVQPTCRRRCCDCRVTDTPRERYVVTDW